MSWRIEWESKAEKQLKDNYKRWEHETTNVLENLDSLLRELKKGTPYAKLKLLTGIRSEPDGILAVDESGPGKGSRMKALRLYVYPHGSQQILHIILFGVKGRGSSQDRDIRECQGFVSRL